MYDTEELKLTIKRLLIEMLHSDPELRSEFLHEDAAARTPTVAEASVPYLAADATELAEYLDFNEPNAIRLRGHRIWIEDVLYEYVYRALNADQLAVRFPSLTQAEIHAVLLYYYRHQAAMDRHLADWLDHGQRAWAAQQRAPTPVMEKLRRLRTERDAPALQSATSSPE